MQNHVLYDNLNIKKCNLSKNPLIKDALGVTVPFGYDCDIAISEEQISILEDAISRYERLEDIRKFSALALDDIDTITEDDIKRAVELENTVSIDNEQAVLNLIQNEGFLKDLESADFSEILSSNSNYNSNYNDAESLDAKVFEEYFKEDFSDFNLYDFEDVNKTNDFQA